MRQSNVVIVLATYNGEKHIREQISSIQSQTYCDWRLLIRDDCSTDQTPNIISELADEDERISIINNKGINLGVIENFCVLMTAACELSNINYVLFSDQDDIWEPEKTQLMLECLQQSEKQFGVEVPLLVHSDLKVVDEHLNEIHSSLMRYQSIRNESVDAWKVLMVQNYVTGCVMAINKPLLDISLPQPDTIMMHDWWLALCASIFGNIVYIDKPLIQYRQHGHNQVGAKGFWARINPLSGKLLDRWSKSKKDFIIVVQQAKSLLDKAEQAQSNSRAISALEEFSNILNYSRFKRLMILSKYNIRRQNKLMSMFLYLRVLTM